MVWLISGKRVTYLGYSATVPDCGAGLSSPDLGPIQPVKTDGWKGLVAVQPTPSVQSQSAALQ